MRESFYTLVIALMLWGVSGCKKQEPAPPEVLQEPAPPEVLVCAADEDCVHYGNDLHTTKATCCPKLCCPGDRCATALTTREYARQHTKWLVANCPKDTACPIANCANPRPVRPWHASYKPVCVKNLCRDKELFSVLPDRAALQFFCRNSQDFSKALGLRSADEREQALMVQTREPALAAGIETWPELARQIAQAGKGAKSWLKAGVVAYKPGNGCTALSTLKPTK